MDLITWRRIRALTIALATMASVGGASTTPASASVERLSVDLQSAAALGPDGHSVSVTVLASCPQRWTVVRASVTVSQAQASGVGSFPLTCIDSIRSFPVTVRSTSGAFRLGSAQGSAIVVIKRGRTEQAQDSTVLDVDPTVVVDLANTASLQGGGEAVVIHVSAACPVGASGQQSYVNVSQGQTTGTGNYVPLCDGHAHDLAVRVQASQGLYRAGGAQALTFAFVEQGGDSFSGVDEQAIEIIAG
jgi:hypothetical protein